MLGDLAALLRLDAVSAAALRSIESGVGARDDVVGIVRVALVRGGDARAERDVSELVGRPERDGPGGEVRAEAVPVEPLLTVSVNSLMEFTAVTV